MAKEWRKLLCKSSELQLLGTLNGGQSFRWKKFAGDADSDFKEHWIGVFKSIVWKLVQYDDYILYKVYSSDNCSTDLSEQPPYKKAKSEGFHLIEEDAEKTLHKYFHLDLNLEKYYKQWCESDPYFKIASEKFYGIRILSQDPVENVFSFICSSNNHISRISSMVEKLCVFYGTKICELNGMHYYSFPKVEALAGPDVETKLRDSGFGYRAKYISKSAQTIMEMGGQDWFDELKKMDYLDAKKQLMTLTGVGAKVADCICLMSLNHLQTIPVDTHVFQIAASKYLPHLSKCKSVTDKVYNEIGEHFRELYGPLAGWAHTVLFCADLKMFQNGDAAVKQESKKTIKKKKK